MRITFNAKELNSALDFLHVSERSAGDTAYIEQVYVKVDNGIAQLFRYGMGLTKASMFLQCQSEVDQVNYQVNYDALKAITQKIAMRFERVNFDVDTQGENKHVTLSAGRLKTQLNITDCVPPDEPTLSEHNEICVLRVELERIIKRARVASGKQDVRATLNGVLLATESDGTLYAVGCDGHRMAMAKCRYLAHIYTEHELIISNSGVKHLDGIFKLADEENLVLHFDNSYFSISLENGARLKMQVVDGRYPDWRRIIPLDHKTLVTLERQELIDSVRSATPLTSQKFRSAKFNIKQDGVCITSESHVGEFSDVVELSSFSGDEQTVGMNLDYLIDALTAITSNSIEIKFTDATRGIVIKEGEGANGVQLIMPLRV